MNSLNKQQGMATILLVLLIGLTVMVITSTVARTLLSNKEANVAAHAQTNVQLMGWSGVSALRTYLMNAYKDKKVTELSLLEGKTISLLNDATTGRLISAKIIKVTGCTGATIKIDEVEGTPCVISAEISSSSAESRAATTIQAVYDLKAGQASIKDGKPSLNYAGNTFLSGTTLSAENPGTEAVLNVDGGHASIQAGFKTKNITQLTINVKKRNGKGGDVIIDCSFTNCGNTKININAEGYVHIIHPGDFGSIKALEWVKLQTGVKADSIEALGDVHLALNSSAGSIKTNGKVTLSEGSFSGDIKTNGDVLIYTNVKVGSIETLGAVTASVSSTINGNVKSGKSINLSSSVITGSAYAYEYVDLDTNSKILGSIYAKNKSKTGIGIYNAAVRLSTSWVGGNIYADGNLRLLDSLIGEDVKGSVTLTGEVKSLFTNTIKGRIKEKQTLASIPELNFTVNSPFNPTEFRSQFTSQIGENMKFVTRIDVTKYKPYANYIFTRTYGVARIYLNQLKNESTGEIYVHKIDTDGRWKQFVKASENISDKDATLLNEEGFYLGKYTRNGNHYVGAICKEILEPQALSNSALILKDHYSGYCKSEIIGYLPRVSMDFTGLNGPDRSIFGFPDDYDFTLPETFYIRSTKNSSIDNASFAPGIMYFHGNVIISGDANINADSMTSTFTNTFLAEGDIDAIAFSPRIYSPYNVIRESNPSTICSRDLASVNGNKFTSGPPATQPATISRKFLTPINLCKDANTFRYDMNKEDNGEITLWDIDGVTVKKLDLGLVALMSNRVIRIGACARIYGDVLARSTVEGSAACGITNNKNSIVGSISTQGVAPYIDGIEQVNTFGAGTNLVIPDSKYTNSKDSVVTQPGIAVTGADLQWSKYL